MKKLFLISILAVSCHAFAAQYLEVPKELIPSYTARLDKLVTITSTTLMYTIPIYGAATRTTVMFPLDERALPILTATETAALVDDISDWLPVPPLP